MVDAIAMCGPYFTGPTFEAFSGMILIKAV
jgi:hypothetical protein